MHMERHEAHSPSRSTGQAEEQLRIRHVMS